MIDNDLLQKALIDKSNSTPNIQTSLASGTITEYNYQGTDWAYPCARLQLESQYDLVDSNVHCPSRLDFSFYVFSEQGTSKQCNQIAAKFVNSFRGLSFTKNSIKFVKIVVLENIPAIRVDDRTWRAQIRCQSIVHNA